MTDHTAIVTAAQQGRARLACCQRALSMLRAAEIIVQSSDKLAIISEQIWPTKVENKPYTLTKTAEFLNIHT